MKQYRGLNPQDIKYIKTERLRGDYPIQIFNHTSYKGSSKWEELKYYECDGYWLNSEYENEIRISVYDSKGLEIGEIINPTKNVSFLGRVLNKLKVWMK